MLTLFRSLNDDKDLGMCGAKRKGVTDDILSSNNKFGISSLK